MSRSLGDTDRPASDLAGARIVVLRGSAWGDRVADRIRARGGEPRVVPLLDIEISDSEPLRTELASWARGEYDWLVLTSMNTVRAVQQAQSSPPAGSEAVRAAAAGITPRVAAVGPATAAAAAQIGLEVSLVPEQDFATEGLLAAIRDAVGARPSRFLFPVSNLTDERMQDALTAAGHQVVRITAYETREVAAPPDLHRQLTEHDPTVVLITSGSAARALHRHFPVLPDGLRIAAIGRSSARSLAELGMRADIVAAEQTIDGLLDSIADHLSKTHLPKGAS